MAHIFHSINPNHILEHVCMSNLHQARIIQTHTDYTETCPFVVSRYKYGLAYPINFNSYISFCSNSKFQTI